MQKKREKTKQKNGIKTVKKKWQYRYRLERNE